MKVLKSLALKLLVAYFKHLAQLEVTPQKTNTLYTALFDLHSAFRPINHQNKTIDLEHRVCSVLFVWKVGC